MKQIISHVVNTRLGFILTLLVLYWLKTMWAYHVDFSLGLENPYQLLLSLINPIPLGLLLLGLSLYIKRTRVFYIVSWIIYTILNLLLISNAIYFREFSDFITVSAMLASSKVSAGLGDSAVNLIRVWILFTLLITSFFLLYLLLRKSKLIIVHLTSVQALLLRPYQLYSFQLTFSWLKLIDLNC